MLGMNAIAYLQLIPHVFIDPSIVYGCVVDMHHHLRRVSDGGFDMQEFFDHPQLYESVFAQEVIKVPLQNFDNYLCDLHLPAFYLSNARLFSVGTPNSGPNVNTTSKP